jgi:hypothetical protein
MLPAWGDRRTFVTGDAEVIALWGQLTPPAPVRQRSISHCPLIERERYSTCEFS